jgi:nitric oxide reductase NorD protein
MASLKRRRIAAELARLDPGGLRDWLRYAVAMERALGVESSRGYSALILAAARRDPRLARKLAGDIPDHLARVAGPKRAQYLELMALVIDERPQASLLAARSLPELLDRLEGAPLREFLRTGLERHERGERVAEHFLKRESREGHQAMEDLTAGVHLKAVRRVLTHYARAHCGEDIQIRPAAAKPQGRAGSYSDGRHVYLPERVDRYGDERDFLVYRAATARTVGHLEFGTFDLELDRVPGDWPERRGPETDIERMLRAYPNRTLARDLFQVAEDARVERRVRAEYPGVARDLDRLRPEEAAERPAVSGLAPVEQLIEALLRRARDLPLDEAALEPRALEALEGAWERMAPACQEGATVQDVAAALGEIYPLAWGLMARAEEGGRQQPPGGGGRDPGGPGGRGGRGPGEPDMPQPRGGSGAQPDAARPDAQDNPYRGLEDDPLMGGIRPDAMTPADRAIEMKAHEQLDAAVEEGIEATLAELRRALRQKEPSRADERSYEEMVAFLERSEAPAGGQVDDGDEEISHRRGGMDQRSGRSLDPDAQDDAPTFIYQEWDSTIGDYKPAWVRLKEHRLQPGSRSFVDAVREEHGAAIRALRRRFEALRPAASARVNRLTDGDDIDLDRAIEARVTRRAGGAPSQRLYQKHLIQRRDVAVAFLLDLSSSTNEVAGESGKRIIEVEKEALTMTAEALDALGDAFAVYGFSGYGREHVAFYVAKDFADAYDDRTRCRIGRMNWKMENRDGAAIRHATRKLAAQRARSKLLILLSDGRPLDCGCDHYFDQYAQDDTRQALREARTAGVHPFCITVDPRGSRYLEAIYGEVGYTIIERAESLPDQLPRIYRRLTR